MRDECIWCTAIVFVFVNQISEFIWFNVNVQRFIPADIPFWDDYFLWVKQKYNSLVIPKISRKLSRDNKFA